MAGTLVEVRTYITTKNSNVMEPLRQVKKMKAHTKIDAKNGKNIRVLGVKNWKKKTDDRKEWKKI